MVALLIKLSFATYFSFFHLISTGVCHFGQVKASLPVLHSSQQLHTFPAKTNLKTNDQIFLKSVTQCLYGQDATCNLAIFSILSWSLKNLLSRNLFFQNGEQLNSYNPTKPGQVVQQHPSIEALAKDRCICVFYVYCCTMYIYKNVFDYFVSTFEWDNIFIFNNCST